MRIINVREMFSETVCPALSKVSEYLDNKGDEYYINTINWDNYILKPEVRFKIGYNKKEIFLKYYVKESFVKAEKSLSNQMVCEDSCVEFFVSPEGESDYYNFEFNCIGTCHLGVGTERVNRILVDPEIISKIRRLPSMGNIPFKEKTGDFLWTLTVAIPLELFFNNEVKDLKNKSFKANLYKCGDKLSSPHYLTWNPVNSEKPDFHRPEFFGELKFK
jgi:hypothetical protein